MIKYSFGCDDYRLDNETYTSSASDGTVEGDVNSLKMDSGYKDGKGWATGSDFNRVNSSGYGSGHGSGWGSGDGYGYDRGGG